MDDIVALRKRLEYTWGWEESVATSLFSPLRSSRKSDTSQCHWLLLCLGYFHCKQVASYFCRPFQQSKFDFAGTPASSMSRRGEARTCAPWKSRLGIPGQQKIIFEKFQRAAQSPARLMLAWVGPLLRRLYTVRSQQFHKFLRHAFRAPRP